MSAQPSTRPTLSPTRVDALIRANWGKVETRRLAAATGLTSPQVVGRARALGVLAHRPWTARELALLRRHYDPADPRAQDALASVLGRPRPNVVEKARLLKLGRAVPRWTKEQDALLFEHFGHWPDTRLAKAVGRGVEATKERAWVLGLKKGRARFRASAVARLLGWDAHKVMDWIAAGRLPAHHSQALPGWWEIDADGFEPWLRRHCHEIDPARMGDPSGYYERLVREARDADPLLAVPDVAARLGVSCDRVRRLIRAGRIAAVRAANHGGGRVGGTYYVRASEARFEPRRPRHPNHTGTRLEDAS